MQEFTLVIQVKIGQRRLPPTRRRSCKRDLLSLPLGHLLLAKHSPITWP